jgi:hypothetical protein
MCTVGVVAVKSLWDVDPSFLGEVYCVTRFEEVLYPLIWMVVFFGAGIIYSPLMPLSILVIVLLGIFVVKRVMRTNG